jgi:general secretion pathway protein D
MIRCAPMAACAWLAFPTFVCATDGDAVTPSAVSTASASDGTDIRKLLLEVGRKLHKTFLVDPRVRASVDLGDLQSRDVTYPMLLAILRIHGFTAFTGDGFVSVVPDANARQFTSPIVDPHNIKAPDDQWVTTIVVLKTINAAQVVPVLRPLMEQAAQLSALTDRNALLLVDVSSNVRRLVALTDAMDALPVPPAKKQD